VSADRHGIAESIESRMERNGGVAVIENVPGHGTHRGSAADPEEPRDVIRVFLVELEGVRVGGR
jgi:hypothetical protein